MVHYFFEVLVLVLFVIAFDLVLDAPRNLCNDTNIQNHQSM